ncbi:MAG: hypothetical protein HZA04_02805 [Nitrospinae bacterium]|nr:hypothetical protein [Nitrospinota bacterium]
MKHFLTNLSPAKLLVIMLMFAAADMAVVKSVTYAATYTAMTIEPKNSTDEFNPLYEIIVTKGIKQGGYIVGLILIFIGLITAGFMHQYKMAAVEVFSGFGFGMGKALYDKFSTVANTASGAIF